MAQSPGSVADNASGAIGAFFARLIKSAVSRQREYLADAVSLLRDEKRSSLSNGS
jgi:hypothetical protein